MINTTDKGLIPCWKWHCPTPHPEGGMTAVGEPSLSTSAGESQRLPKTGLLKPTAGETAE